MSESNNKFFEDFGDYVLRAHFYENSQSITIEELYQAFKTRVLTETIQAQVTGGEGKIENVPYADGSPSREWVEATEQTEKK